MSYRNDVDALAARHAALEGEVAAAAKQRDDAKRLLDEARERAKLPVLDNLRVASPCSEQWAAMPGDERVRACDKCKQNVYNLSALTRAEAEALIVERNGRMCVRYYQRADGTILLADCTVGRRNKRVVRAVAAGIAASIAGGGAYGLLSHARNEHVMGDMMEVAGGIGPPPPMDEQPQTVQDEVDPPAQHVSMKLPR
jgi:hypothetical protein